MREGRLGVIRDGVDLPEDQARALWRAYTEHLERDGEDLEGFARAHGFLSVRAERRRGRAILVVSTRAQRPKRAPAKVREPSPAPPKVAGRRR